MYLGRKLVYLINLNRQEKLYNYVDPKCMSNK